MDIFSKLKISYQVESKNVKGKYTTFDLLVDGEKLLIAFPEYNRLDRNEKLLIVISLIKKDRLLYTMKEFSNISFHKIPDKKQPILSLFEEPPVL